MSDSGKAVFLSYASQDAEAAKRICEALRQAGVEVWFDQNELVGGDAWAAKIRGQTAGETGGGEMNAERPMTESIRTDSPRITRMTADSLSLSATISVIRGNGLAPVLFALGVSVPLWFNSDS